MNYGSVNSVKKIELEELKQIELEILKDFKNICEKENIMYSLLAGTIIGAVRHKGFIPWDDDIDICMPRDEYTKFVKYCKNNETPFLLINNETDKNYGYMFAVLSNPKTKIVEHVGNRYDIDMGVHIDIFIYDAMGNTYEEAVKNYNKSRFSRELLVAANWKKYSKSKTHSIIYEPIRLCFFLLSRFVNFSKQIRKIEKKYTSKSFYDSEFVGNLCSDMRARSIIEQSAFDSYVELEFEKETFKVFKGYETYLKNVYGDYMQLPPVEKRVTHHTFDAYWK